MVAAMVTGVSFARAMSTPGHGSWSIGFFRPGFGFHIGLAGKGVALLCDRWWWNGRYHFVDRGAVKQGHVRALEERQQERAGSNPADMGSPGYLIIASIEEIGELEQNPGTDDPKC